jgi:hypothetical protein
MPAFIANAASGISRVTAAMISSIPGRLNTHRRHVPVGSFLSKMLLRLLPYKAIAPQYGRGNRLLQRTVIFPADSLIY